MPQAGELPHEVDQRIVLLGKLPVDPADLVVLTICVVVALLCATEFVAREQHRRALREAKRRHEITNLTLAQPVDFGIVGRTFYSTIP